MRTEQSPTVIDSKRVEELIALARQQARRGNVKTAVLIIIEILEANKDFLRDPKPQAEL